MKEFIKNYWKTIAFFAVVGLVGGFFTGLYLLDSYPAQLRQQLLNELAAQGLDFLSADRAMWNTYSGVKKTQIVINFCNSTHS